MRSYIGPRRNGHYKWKQTLIKKTLIIVIFMSPPFNITINLRSASYILPFDMPNINKSDTKVIAIVMGGHQNPIYCLVHLWCDKCKRKNILVHHFLWDGDSANAITRFPRVSYPIQLLWRWLGAPNDHIAHYCGRPWWMQYTWKGIAV